MLLGLRWWKRKYKKHIYEKLKTSLRERKEMKSLNIQVNQEQIDKERFQNTAS